MKKPCKDRYEGKAPDQSPGAPGVLKMGGDSRLRVILGSAVFTYPLPLSVYEVLTGRSGATDQPGGE